MKKVVFAFVALFPLFFACQKTTQECDCVSQQYMHKYGFPLTEKEWMEREKDGQIISRLKNGCTVTNNYIGGVLHGASTLTYPHSSVIQKHYDYDMGSLVKRTFFDTQGIPYREELNELDGRVIVTSWNEKGVPLSIEEYEKGRLLEGQYFNAKHELEASIENGEGSRLQRARNGSLLSKDVFHSGSLASRTSFHPDGRIATVSNFQDYQLQGKQLIYSPTGSLSMEMNWEGGLLHGSVITYCNDAKVKEVPFIHGKKQGVETQHNDKGELIAEIHWDHDQKHGSSHYYENNNTKIQWYFRGDSVSLRAYERLDMHEKMVAGLD